MLEHPLSHRRRRRGDRLIKGSEGGTRKEREGMMKDGDIVTNQSERAAQPSNWGLENYVSFSGKDEFKSQHRGDVSQSDLSLQSRR